MRKVLFAAVAVVALGVLAVAPGQAHASWLSEALHAQLDPAYYPYYYPYPYSYYDPSAVYIDNDPPVYVERDTGAGVQREGEYSYYCTDPAGYYPQVPNCNKAWLKVVPDGSATPRPR